MSESGSLINLGELSKPATVLIEKIAEATGGIFRPFQIRRVAQAEAGAAIIKASAKIQIADLEHRALNRFIYEEAKKQSNIESIAQKALPAVEEKADPQKIEDDWITNFFDKCRLISDEQMQTLWSKILAGEANSPGRFSKRTVNLLGSFGKADAELFNVLCSFVWYLEEKPIPMIYDVTTGRREIYAKARINHYTLRHLETIGLINFEPGGNTFGKHNLPSEILLGYYGIRVKITFQKPDNNTLDHGKVILTKAGEELAPVSDSSPRDGFKDYVMGWWKSHHYIATEV